MNIPRIQLNSALLLNIAIAIAVFAIAIIPQQQKLSSAVATYVELRHEQAVLQDTVAQRVITTDTITALEQDDLLMHSVLPESHVIQFIESVESIAATADVEHNVQFRSNERGTGAAQLITIPTALFATGTWPAITHFMTELEQQAFYIVPNRVVLSSQFGVSDTMELNIDGISYWLEE